MDTATRRKGNWVILEGKKGSWKKLGIMALIYMDFDGEVYADVHVDDLDPIVISPEILLDFGFEEFPPEEVL